MNWTAVVSLVLVGLGTILILLGAFMSYKDWNQKNASGVRAEVHSMSLNGLAKLADALKTYPPGQQMIVWGIVILIIAGLFGGVSGLK